MFSSKRKADDDASPDKAAKMANGGPDVRKATFTRSLEALNSQFASWVAEQSGSAPKELWTDGVEDYLKYAKQLLADYTDVLEGSGKPEPAPFAPSAAPGGGSSKPPLAPSIFGAPSSSQGGASAGGATAAAAPASIFGALPPGGGCGAFGLGSSAPAGGAFGGFGGSGGGSAANSAGGGGGGGGLFSVPSSGTLGSSFNTAGATAGGDGEEGEEEEEEPAEPSVQVEAGEGTEILVKQRVKLMSLDPEKKWKDRGQGTLTLRRAVGEDAAAKRPYFVFTTDSGRVLINAPLYKGLKPSTTTKSPANLIMFLISSVDGVEDRCMHVFKCESAAVSQQMIKTIEELAV